jgi:hypothetical protein
MRQTILAVIVVLVLAAGAGVGYLGRVTSRQTTTATSTTTSILTTTSLGTELLPANATICEGIVSCGAPPVGPVQFSVRYNISVAAASAPNTPPTCQRTEPKNESYIELVTGYAPNNATLSGITFWIQNQLIKQNITSSCTLSNSGSPEYVIETGIGDNQAHGYAAFATMFSMTDCASGGLPAPCAFQLYSLGELNPAS